MSARRALARVGHAMSTINGIGTMFYGWRGLGTPASTATRWVTFLYLPIVPLARFELSPVTDFEREKFLSSPGAVAAALVGYASRTDAFRVARKLPLSFPEVVGNYLKAYVGLPLAVAWPALLLVAFRMTTGVHPEWEDRPWFTPAVIAFVAVALLDAIAVPMWAIQAARGLRAGLLRRRRF